MMAKHCLAALMLLMLGTPAVAVEVCKVVDLQLVTQTGEFFLAGISGSVDAGCCVVGGMGKSDQCMRLNGAF
jgi:hypothetical protein